MTHICVGKLIIIGSDNGLSSGRHQAIIWTNVGIRLMPGATLRNKLQWNINRNSYIFIQENAFENVVWKMAAIFSRPQWVKIWASFLGCASRPTLSYCILVDTGKLYFKSSKKCLNALFFKSRQYFQSMIQLSCSYNIFFPKIGKFSHVVNKYLCIALDMWRGCGG